MKHQSLDQILNQATVLEAAPILSRRERLARWAEILSGIGPRRIQVLKFVEFYSAPERARLRGEQTPLAFAYADPMLRAAGLSGDTYGEVLAFFGLSEREAHFLLCDCHWSGRITGERAARRVRAVANPNLVNRLWMKWQMD